MEIWAYQVLVLWLGNVDTTFPNCLIKQPLQLINREGRVKAPDGVAALQSSDRQVHKHHSNTPSKHPVKFAHWNETLWNSPQYNRHKMDKLSINGVMMRT